MPRSERSSGTGRVGDGRCSPGREPCPRQSSVRHDGSSLHRRDRHTLPADWLDSILAPLRTADEATSRYRLRDGDPAVLLHNDDVLSESTPERGVATLLWHIIQEAVVRSPRHARLHAAVACRGAAAVVLPAAMEAGKTTLVTGLVRAGFGLPLRRARRDRAGDGAGGGLPEGALDRPGLVGHPRPTSPERLRRHLPRQWLVPVTSIRSDTTAAEAVPRLLIAPATSPAPRQLFQPMSRRTRSSTPRPPPSRSRTGRSGTSASCMSSSSDARAIASS